MPCRCRRAPSWPWRCLGIAVWAFSAVVIAAACADTGDGPLQDEEPVSETVATTTPAAPAAPAVTEAPTTSEGPPAAVGTVEVGDTAYQFDEGTCEERGAGEVVVDVKGDDPVSGGRVQLYVKASLADPYIGLRLPDGTLLEPSLDSPLDVYLQDDVIRASAIRFVRDLDLETGAATEVGFGELEIHCYEYSNELPE